MTEHPEDLPWNDQPDDENALPGVDDEPSPAEVSGDEDDDAKRDDSLPRTLTAEDEYRRETLDERLAEEEPDVAEHADDPQAPNLLAPEPSGDRDYEGAASEPDRDDAARPRLDTAEEDAVRLEPDDRLP